MAKVSATIISVIAGEKAEFRFSEVDVWIEAECESGCIGKRG